MVNEARGTGRLLLPFQQSMHLLLSSLVSTHTNLLVRLKLARTKWCISTGFGKAIRLGKSKHVLACYKCPNEIRNADRTTAGSSLFGVCARRRHIRAIG